MKKTVILLWILYIIGIVSGFTIFVDEMPANRVFFCRDINGTLTGTTATLSCANSTSRFELNSVPMSNIQTGVFNYTFNLRRETYSCMINCGANNPVFSFIVEIRDRFAENNTVPQNVWGYSSRTITGGTISTVNDKTGYALTVAEKDDIAKRTNTSVWASSSRTLTACPSGCSQLTTSDLDTYCDTKSDVWSYSPRTITGGTVDTVNDKTGYALTDIEKNEIAKRTNTSVWSSPTRTLTSCPPGCSQLTTTDIDTYCDTSANVWGYSSRTLSDYSGVWSYSPRTLTSCPTGCSTLTTTDLNSYCDTSSDIWSYSPRTITGGTITTVNDKTGYSLTTEEKDDIAKRTNTSVWASSSRTLTSCPPGCSQLTTTDLNNYCDLASDVWGYSPRTLTSCPTGCSTLTGSDIDLYCDTSANVWTYSTRTLSDYSGVWTYSTRGLTLPVSINNENITAIATAVDKSINSSHGEGLYNKTITGAGGGATAEEIWTYSTRSLTSPVSIYSSNITSIAIAVDLAINASHGAGLYNKTYTGTGGATAEEVWTYPTRSLTDKSGFGLAPDAVNISTFTQGAADKVWLSTSRTLSSFGTLVSDIWNYATRTLTSPVSLNIENMTAIASYVDLSINKSHGEGKYNLTGALVWAHGTRTLTAFNFAVRLVPDAVNESTFTQTAADKVWQTPIRSLTDRDWATISQLNSNTTQILGAISGKGGSNLTLQDLDTYCDTRTDIYNYFTQGNNEDVFKADVSNLATISQLNENISKVLGAIAGKGGSNLTISDLDTYCDVREDIYNYFIQGNNEDAFKADVSNLATISQLNANTTKILNAISGKGGSNLTLSDLDAYCDVSSDIYNYFTYANREDEFKADVSSLATISQLNANTTKILNAIAGKGGSNLTLQDLDNYCDISSDIYNYFTLGNNEDVFKADISVITSQLNSNISKLSSQIDSNTTQILNSIKEINLSISANLSNISVVVDSKEIAREIWNTSTSITNITTKGILEALYEAVIQSGVFTAYTEDKKPCAFGIVNICIIK